MQMQKSEWEIMSKQDSENPPLRRGFSPSCKHKFIIVYIQKI